MKRICALVLAAVLLFGLSACKAAEIGLKPGSHPDPSGTSSASPNGTTTSTVIAPPLFSPDVISFSNPGKQRISYNGNINGIRYVTSASQLSDSDAFKAYDDAWFQDHALILIVETVTSGSIDIEIDSISVADDTAHVTLRHNIPENCTADMATWLLWAEVEAGLELRWCVENPAVKPNYESQ